MAQRKKSTRNTASGNKLFRRLDKLVVGATSFRALCDHIRTQVSNHYRTAEPGCTMSTFLAKPTTDGCPADALGEAGLKKGGSMRKRYLALTGKETADRFGIHEGQGKSDGPEQELVF